MASCNSERKQLPPPVQELQLYYIAEAMAAKDPKRKGAREDYLPVDKQGVLWMQDGAAGTFCRAQHDSEALSSVTHLPGRRPPQYCANSRPVSVVHKAWVNNEFRDAVKDMARHLARCVNNSAPVNKYREKKDRRRKAWAVARWSGESAFVAMALCESRNLARRTLHHGKASL